MFASYREKARAGSLELGSPNGSTAGDVAAQVSAMYPGLVSDPSGIVVAVNREYREHGHVLSDGSPHREAALRTCAQVADRIKQTLPIWKNGYIYLTPIRPHC